MRTRLVGAVAALALAAAEGGAQTLTPFRSRAELVEYAEELSARHARRLDSSYGAVENARGADDAQGPAVIRGRVTDPSGAPLPGAQVQLAGRGVPTGADGTYRMEVPAAHLPVRQDVVLNATRAGMSPTARILSLGRGDSAQVDFVLIASPAALEGVVVNQLNGRAAGTSITNVQTAGVDEGGIVKAHGDHLVMLRRGRLFTVRVGGSHLRPVSVVDAYPPGTDPDDVWYDEMLVSGDQVVVIGYSYAGEGTELGFFDIDRAGRLTYRETYHLRSEDYFSSRNYAGRLVGTTLVFYTPVELHADDLAGTLPALRRWRRGARDEEFAETLSATRIFRPGRELDAGHHATLHTVTRCDLARRPLRCESSAVLGPESRVFYVSGNSVYVWVSEWEDTGAAPAMVYRLPLDGGAPTALGVSGGPVDQFSFLEDGGHLNVVVRAGTGGDAMWSAERMRGGTALLRVPLSRFGDGSLAAPAAAYRPLPGPRDGSSFRNRFVGRHLLYGTGDGWGRSERRRLGSLYAVPVEGGRVAQVALPHTVDRIEVMGEDAVVVGAAGDDLHFTGIDLAGRPRRVQRYVSRGARQGELRSHGFFYRPDGEESGTLGLPIRGPGKPGYEHLFEESSSVLFLRNQDGGFRPLGGLDARAEGSVDDGCKVSCVDWYGNSRPIFLGRRIFALMGYELVEGAVRGGRIREVRRVSYAPAGR